MLLSAQLNSATVLIVGMFLLPLLCAAFYDRNPAGDDEDAGKTLPASCQRFHAPVLVVVVLAMVRLITLFLFCLLPEDTTLKKHRQLSSLSSSKLIEFTH